MRETAPQDSPDPLVPARFDAAAVRYLELLKRCVTNVLYEDPPINPTGLPNAQPAKYDFQLRAKGADWPSLAHTMIGLKRLDNLQELIEIVIDNEIPGDLCEAGVWRGGAAIFMRGALVAGNAAQRVLWLADSFEGTLPRPGTGGLSSRSYSSPNLRAARDPAVWQNHHRIHDALRVGTSLSEVQHAIERYGLLDDRVRFLEGYFCDTLNRVDSERLSLIHIDCDLYDSTLQVLEAVYFKLSPGGFVVVDDYGCYSECKLAVDEFRNRRGEHTAPVRVDREAVYWRKP